jgi:hypothetical protein
VVAKKKPAPTKLDLGSGKNKKEGFHGVDQYKMDGVDTVLNIGSAKWPWADNSIEEVNCSHFIEHLTNFNDKWERVHFFNELYRVMKPGAKATLIFPHWCSNRFYGDPTHKEPLSEMWAYYLSRDWRATQAPHTDIKWNKNGYDCSFTVTWGYSFAPELGMKNQEYVQFALANYKEACQDVHATLVKV